MKPLCIRTKSDDSMKEPFGEGIDTFSVFISIVAVLWRETIGRFDFYSLIIDSANCYYKSRYLQESIKQGKICVPIMASRIQ